jgi:hypothetical protein
MIMIAFCFSRGVLDESDEGQTTFGGEFSPTDTDLGGDYRLANKGTNPHSIPKKGTANQTKQ